MPSAIEKDGDKAVVRVDGKLDATYSPILSAELEPELDGITDLTIDLEDVDYVSSMGLRLLLSLQKRMFKQGELHVTNVPDDIMQLFTETGFTEIFAIE